MCETARRVKKFVGLNLFTSELVLARIKKMNGFSPQFDIDINHIICILRTYVTYHNLRSTGKNQNNNSGPDCHLFYFTRKSLEER